ncbi:alpha/beta hydrolase [Tsukamurella tyrosinosolvens]|uniref:alpha/beta hydrolase n=1 Tax=Tsukamurella tyrosinosolvens TaxID=57704 RepID=UPI001CE06018|nr:alpha/beta hydrolase [Tsukamurella tyrosinosolvens]MCA4995232.1 alpha/beta hydrolase [Tsukamurella tyrosinosolvens]
MGLQEYLRESADISLDSSRIRLWSDLNESNLPQPAIGFLVAMLGSVQEREATAAAAALWRGLFVPRSPRLGQMPTWVMFDYFEYTGRISSYIWPWFYRQGRPFDEDDGPSWDPDLWQQEYSSIMSAFRGNSYAFQWAIAMLTRVRLENATQSPDDVARELATAALYLPDDRNLSHAQTGHFTPQTSPGALVVSTMIHGTFGWKGDWWRPKGNFHRYILQNHRPNLFSRGARYSWSGAYSENQREIAASDFMEWSKDVAPHGIQTVFGHSYGGEVASRAAVTGASMHEMVLLSTPVTKHVIAAADTGIPIVDVRLRLDPILLLARTHQRIPSRPNVTEVLLKRWQLSHGATHDEQVWQAENVAVRGKL